LGTSGTVRGEGGNVLTYLAKIVLSSNFVEGMNMTHLHRIAVSLVIAAVGLPMAANAQSYPTKTIRVIIGYAAGGGLDYTARLVGQHLSTTLGHPVIVENRPGAGGTMAEEQVSRSEPDGYTLIYSVGSDMAARKFLTRKPALDPNKDFTPIATAIGSGNIILLNPSHPAKNLAQLVEFSKRNPGRLTYGTAGVQSYYYLIGELLKQNGIDMLHIPYKGNAPVVTALAAGEVDIGLVNFAAALPMIKAGKARVLAVLESKRFPSEPDLPTVAEALPTFKAPLSWFGYFGPPGIPQPIVERLNTEINRALDTPDIRGKITALYLNIITLPPDQLRPFIAESADLFGRIIKTANIKPFDD
ncbi:MAG: Bug family tripartite tricarboxylate transporter substrate binding protein, partial [Burkholderiales bacterium]